jgi:DNA-binding transcriptional ArsR family regulator
MRKSTALDSLLPNTRQQVLAATLLQPDRWWYLSELAQSLGVTPSTLQRELSGLTQAGVLQQRIDGNRVYYRANNLCPFLGDLQGLLIKTVGLIDLLKGALKPLKARTDVAFIFGSFAESRELVTSDVDLMIIGEVGLADVAPLLRKVEGRFNRPVNPVVLSAQEAKDKLAKRNHFLETVRKSNKLFLWGEESELGETFSK